MHSSSDKTKDEINSNRVRAPFERHSPHAHSYLQQVERLPSIHSIISTNSDAKNSLKQNDVRIQDSSFPFSPPFSHPPSFTHPQQETNRVQSVDLSTTTNTQPQNSATNTTLQSNSSISKPIKFYSFQYKASNNTKEDAINNTSVDASIRSSPLTMDLSRPSAIKKNSSTNSKVELSKEAIMKYMAYSQAEAAEKLGVSLSTLRRFWLSIFFFLLCSLCITFFGLHRRFTELNMNIRWPVHSKRSKVFKNDTTTDTSGIASSSSDNPARQEVINESSNSSGGSQSLEYNEKHSLQTVLNSDLTDPKLLDGNVMDILTKAFSFHEGNVDDET